MEYIEGVSVVDPDVAGLSLLRRNALGKGMLELFFYELYEWGMLQTDPNFGNYLLRLDDRRKKIADDELVLLDFGSVLHCSEHFLCNLRQTIEAGQQQDFPRLVEGLIGLGCLQKETDEDGRKIFADFCMHLLEPLRSPEQLPTEYLNANGEYCWGKSQLLRRAAKKAAMATTSRHFATPSRDFALIARKLTGLFNFIAALDAEFNAHDMVQLHIHRWKIKDRNATK
jgi:predicted unusual protein kinase regulating ubiquinone biosynthesis (AarF/ABC1/UbiB family)